ncbi:MAG: hypothetical protein ACREQH_09050 [Candidatus Binatus sp.]
MDTTEEKARIEVRIEPLRGLPLVMEVAGGVGRTLGLTLLWGLEIVRDSYFRLLDRLNVRPRHKRASAFPPGQPKKHNAPAR